MLISSTGDSATSSASPFPSNSAEPFGNVGQPDRRPAVLIIENDIGCAERLVGALRANGFQPLAVHRGEDGLALLQSRTFDIVLLDWVLPHCDGIEFLKTLRARNDRTPVFLMNSLDGVEDRIRGFESGADDYLVKPFVFSELLARVRARLRRAWQGDALRWRIGDLVLHVESRRVHRGGREISLTPREFDLLLHLVQRPAQVVTREMISREVWRMPRHPASLDNAIDVHIAHLRRKVDASFDLKLIHTVRGEGFVVYEAPPLDAKAVKLDDGLSR